MNRKRRMIVVLLGVVLLLGIVTLVVSARVEAAGRTLVVDAHDARLADAALVLGAFVRDDHPCGTLAMRLEAGRQLYLAHRVRKILVSGDHGQDDYDEVNAMRDWLVDRGIPPQDIFMDHAGFNTYDSMVRARQVFAVHTVIVVTQGWHLPRALYIASHVGLDAQGVEASEAGEGSGLQRLRECLARVKAFIDVSRAREPRFLGPRIPIQGDGRVTEG